MNLSNDRFTLHKNAALNLSPMAIIAKDKIAEQVLDQYGIDKEIRQITDHLNMVNNPMQYVFEYTLRA